MLASDRVLHAAFAENGSVLCRRDHPELLSALQRHRRLGSVCLVLPGTFVPAHLVGDDAVRARAAVVWSPDAVLTGRIAARLTFWPTLKVDAVDVALPRQPRCTRPGYAFVERAVPPELVIMHHGLRVTSPALTALDLCVAMGGDGIDRVLLRRATTLSMLHEALALTPHRRGNLERARLLLESRDEPWSGAEREAHLLLRSAGIVGWAANHPVLVGGSTYFLDLAFVRERLAIEIDGRGVHSDPDAFERDRLRQNALVNAGGRVLRFTWRMLTEQPSMVVATLLEALALR